MKGILKQTMTMLVVTSLIFSHPNTGYAKKSIKLNHKKLTLTVGKKATLKVKGTKKKVTYKSSNKKIVHVSKKGTVKAIKMGNAKITVTIKGQKKRLQCKVKVLSKPTPTPTSEPYGEISKLGATQISDTSFQLMQSCASEDLADDKNVMISPYSIITALCMVDEGANGNTKTQLEKVLNGSFDHAQFAKDMSNETKRLNYKDGISPTKTNCANSIWMNNNMGITFSPAFVESNKKLFQAQAFVRTFGDSTVTEINKWVSENTNKMIPALLSKLDKDAAMVLINALSFQGKWSEPYDKDQIKEGEYFTNGKGAKEKATMLYERDVNNYIEIPGGAGFVKYYMGGYAFMAFLPNSGTTPGELLKSLDGATMQSIFEGLKNRPTGKTHVVHSKIPKFSYEYTADKLPDSLKSMGITDAFDRNKANLLGMVDTMDLGNLYISDVVHKAKINLDENGTDAAAATAVTISKATSAPGKEQIEHFIYLDRPFAYAIVDMNTQIPLFLGTVNSLEK